MAHPAAITTVDAFHLQDEASIFDFTKVSDGAMRLRMMEAIKILYSGASGCSAMMRIINGVRARSGRNIQFFDESGPALQGTRSPPPIKAAAGFSVWRSDGWAFSRWNSQETAIGDRIDERICLYPSAWSFFPGVVMATWHEMTHIFTPLNHKTYNPQANTYDPASDPLNLSCVAHINALKSCAPEMGSDPATSRPTIIRDGTAWVCNCGTTSIDQPTANTEKKG